MTIRMCLPSIFLLVILTLASDLVWAQTTPTNTGLGPVLPEDIQLPPNPVTDWGAKYGLRFFGWANAGYTGSSSGQGLLLVEPRANRFGDSWLLNQAALVLERELYDPQIWWWGFRAEFYMGADPALLKPDNAFGPRGEQFATDFRQAYFSLHVPLLTEGGIDIKFGRQYTPMGYETTMAPYRPMYSEGYAWFYSQNGATTGVIGTFHVNPRLDLIAGITFGVNSLFDLRGDGPCYIARGLYWLDSQKRTKVVGTIYTGPEPIATAEGHVGTWQTEVEALVVHDVNSRVTLASDTNLGWDTRDPGNKLHTSSWFGTYGMAIFHLHRLLDLNFRVEWFDDADGSRIGTRGNYGEITMGINFMPTIFLNFRPEVRWDGAENPVFGVTNASHLQRHQWTYAFETLVKF